MKSRYKKVRGKSQGAGAPGFNEPPGFKAEPSVGFTHEPSNPPQHGPGPGGSGNFTPPPAGAGGAAVDPNAMYKQGIPITADLERFMSSLQKEGDVATANAGQERRDMYQDYFDPRDPFSRQALAARSLDNQRRVTRNSYGANGDLYSGAMVSGQKETEFGGAMAQDDLLRQYATGARGIDRGLSEQLMGLAGQGEEAWFNAASDRAYDIESTPVPAGKVRPKKDTEKPKKPKGKK